MIGLLALDLALAALAVGLVGLCGFAIALLVGVTTVETRRRPQAPLALPPVPTRRVITGTPVELPSTVPTVAAGAEPAPVAGTPEGSSELAGLRLGALEDAERTVRRMMDEDPEAVVRLISAWLAQDRATGGREVFW